MSQRRVPRSFRPCRGGIFKLGRHRAFIGFVAVALLGDFGGVAASEPPSASHPWFQVETEHFSLFGNRPREELVGAAVDLERFWEMLARIAPGTRSGGSRPTRVYLFRDAASFAPFRLTENVDSAGYFLPGDEVSYAAFGAGKLSRQVFKQYVHEILNRYLPEQPAWLRHGVAEYYSTFEMDTKEARIGLPLRGHLWWLALPTTELLPMARLLAMPEPSARDEEGARSLFYAQSWAAVHSLMAGDTAHRRKIVDYMNRIREGEDPVAAFPPAFGISLADYDAALAEYVRGDRFTYLRLPVDAPEAFPTSVTPLDEAETAYRLGDLLLRLGPSRLRAAEGHLLRAVALDPRHAAAWTGLAHVAESSGDAPEALVRLEKAAELAPDDVAVQLALGKAHLRQLGGQRASDEPSRRALAQAAEAFRRATALQPDSGEAWAGLGRAGALAAEPDPQAVTAFERALELLPPGRPDVIYGLLAARARVGDVDGVEEAEERLRAAGADDALLNQAREVWLQVMLGEARELAYADRLGDAVAVLVMVRAETENPAVAEQATTLLEPIARAEAHNRFARDYGEAARLYRAGDLSAAAVLVDRMLANASPGRQTEILEEFRDRIASDESFVRRSRAR